MAPHFLFRKKDFISTFILHIPTNLYISYCYYPYNSTMVCVLDKDPPTCVWRNDSWMLEELRNFSKIEISINTKHEEAILEEFIPIGYL